MSSGDTRWRCFLALDLAPAARLALHVLQAALQARWTTPDPPHWVEAAVLHLTLRYLGVSTPNQRERIAATLPALARGPVMQPLTASSIAVWPPAAPRVLVLELAHDAMLADLAARGEAVARACGFAPEPHPFRSHVTLGRWSRSPCRSPLPIDTALPGGLHGIGIALHRSPAFADGQGYARLAYAPLSADGDAGRA